MKKVFVNYSVIWPGEWNRGEACLRRDELLLSFSNSHFVFWCWTGHKHVRLMMCLLNCVLISEVWVVVVVLVRVDESYSGLTVWSSAAVGARRMDVVLKCGRSIYWKMKYWK